MLNLSQVMAADNEDEPDDHGGDERVIQGHEQEHREVKLDRDQGHGGTSSRRGGELPYDKVMKDFRLKTSKVWKLAGNGLRFFGGQQRSNVVSSTPSQKL